LKRPGKVLHVTKGRMILVKATTAPPINSKVFNNKGREIGYVYDVFGPVKAPYVLVRTRENPEKVKHEVRGRVYFLSSSKKRRFSNWREMRRK